MEFKARFVAREDEPFGVYEFVDGVPHWRKQLFRRLRAAQPHGLADATPSGVLDESDEAFKDMEGRYPQVGELRRVALHDVEAAAPRARGRQRRPQSHAAWAVRHQDGAERTEQRKVHFRPGEVGAISDYAAARSRSHSPRLFSQQEVHIAAVVSGDAALLEACQTGDVYLGVAKQLGLAPDDATPKTHRAVRALFKTVVLGILYGLGPRTLAMQTGVSLFEAAENPGAAARSIPHIRGLTCKRARSCRLVARNRHAVRLDHAVPARQSIRAP